MKFYIYNIETNEIVVTIERETNQECENQACDYLNSESYAATYSPALGCVDGLTLSDEVKEL